MCHICRKKAILFVAKAKAHAEEAVTCTEITKCKERHPGTTQPARQAM